MKQKQKQNNVTFTELLTVAFIHLKLSHQIDWSWFWVIFPTLISIVLSVLTGLLNAKREEKEREILHEALGGWEERLNEIIKKRKEFEDKAKSSL